MVQTDLIGRVVFFFFFMIIISLVHLVYDEVGCCEPGQK